MWASQGFSTLPTEIHYIRNIEDLDGYDDVIPPVEVIDNLRKWLKNLEGLRVRSKEVKEITAEAYDRKNKATEQLKNPKTQEPNNTTIQQPKKIEYPPKQKTHTHTQKDKITKLDEIGARVT